MSACIIGAVGGVLVLIGESILETKLLRIDDPVSAVPVHLFCGVWGTVAVGIFAQNFSREFNSVNNISQQIIYQILGCGCVVLATFLLSLLTWICIGLFLYYSNQDISYQYPTKSASLLTLARRGLRVTVEDERTGNDATIIT